EPKGDTEVLVGSFRTTRHDSAANADDDDLTTVGAPWLLGRGNLRVDLLLVRRCAASARGGVQLQGAGRRDEEQVGERGGPARGHRSAEVVADEGCRGGEPTGLWWVDGRIPALLGDPAVVASGAPVRIVELDCHVDAGVRPADVRDDWVRRR